LKNRKRTDALLNIAIAALSVTAVFAVFTTLEFQTSETPPIDITTLAVISETEPETSEQLPETETSAISARTFTPQTTSLPLAASNEAESALITIDSDTESETAPESTSVSETETTPETKATTKTPETIQTTAKTTTKPISTTKKTTTAADLVLFEETEPAEYQLFEEFEEEQSLIVITMPVTSMPETSATPPTSFITGYTDPPVTTTAASQIPPTSVPVSDTITARVDGVKGSYNTFDLLCGIVYNEVGSSFSDEAIKAQTVAAYTYLKYYEQNGDTPSVSVDKKYPERIKNLVASVYGQACFYNGKYAQTVYSASTGGYTASAENVWGGRIPYLVSVATPHDVASDPNYGIKKTVSVSEVKNALEQNLGITLSENPANGLIITSRIDGNYVDTVSVDGKDSVSGRKLRENILNFNIRSAAFDVYFDGQNFVFTTYGYGHGVGMSQHGANILAKQGMSYIDILKFYYSGVEVR
jgi:stage II sporulation protein D